MHDGLSSALAKRIIELGTVVLSEVVASERLTTVLVDALKDLLIRDTVSCEFPYQCHG